MKCPRCKRLLSFFWMKYTFKVKVSDVYPEQNDEFLRYDTAKVCRTCHNELYSQQRAVLDIEGLAFYARVMFAEKYGLRCGICKKGFGFDPDGVIYHAYFEHGLDEAESYSYDELVQIDV